MYGWVSLLSTWNYHNIVNWGGEGDDRGWDGWMASQTRWTWVWVNSGSWWWTGRPGVLRFMGSQRVRHNWATELNWTGYKVKNLIRKKDLGKVSIYLDFEVLAIQFSRHSWKATRNWNSNWNEYMPYLFIHSSVDEYFDCFKTLATINNGAVNIRMHVSFQISILVSF